MFYKLINNFKSFQILELHSLNHMYAEILRKNCQTIENISIGATPLFPTCPSVRK